MRLDIWRTAKQSDQGVDRISDMKLPVTTEGPGVKRRVIVLGASAGVIFICLYVFLPSIAGVDETWAQISEGNPRWLLTALAFEALSFLSYTAFFRLAISATEVQIDWRASYRITMAGVVATRVLAIAGAGGIALTIWALQKGGMKARQIATSMATFYVVLYGIYMACLAGFGFGLASGLFAGPAPAGLTVAPAIFGGLVITAALVIGWISPGLEHRPGSQSEAKRTRVRRALSTAAATVSSGVRGGVALLRAPSVGLLGAVGWWAFDIAVLWVCLKAFGANPGGAVIVMAYFVGMAANVLPVPGGIGAVDGGIVAALVGFGVPAGTALVGVLSYRAVAFWLPIVPGVHAYLQLLRSPRQDDP